MCGFKNRGLLEKHFLRFSPLVWEVWSPFFIVNVEEGKNLFMERKSEIFRVPSLTPMRIGCLILFLVMWRRIACRHGE